MRCHGGSSADDRRPRAAGRTGPGERVYRRCQPRAARAAGAGRGEDAAEAQRGKLAEIPDGLITRADGAVVWDWRPYAFLDAARAPASVNPSLWRQARLNRIHGLFEVVPGAIWQVRGYDISVMTIVRGKTGYIIIDPLTAEETAAAAWQLAMAHLPPLLIRSIIFTHSHSDHFGGVGGIITRDEALKQGIRIIAPHGFSQEAVAENVLAGTAMARRATYMFGSLLAPGPLGQVDTGLGPRLPAGTIGYMEPTETVPVSGDEVVIDGITFDFMDAGGTEAPAEFMFYIADYQALHTAEVATRVMHNVLTLRGAQVRDPLHWSKVIDRALQKWGGTAQLALAFHGWPLWGKERVQSYLAGQRDAYRYVHDRTLNRANNGATLHEVAEGVAEAPVQQRAFDTRGYYGTLNHNMKATYQRYFGWWDGVPANFNPLPPEDMAKRYVALAGGPAKLLAAGLHMAFERAVDDDRTVRAPARPAVQRLEARDQFCRLERLGEGIIRPAIQPLGAVAAAPQRRQDQDRRADAAVAQAPGDRQPVKIAEHAIEDDDIEGFTPRAQQGRAAAGFPHQHVSAGIKDFARRSRRARVILDIQDPHGVSWPRGKKAATASTKAQAVAEVGRAGRSPVGIH